MVADGDALERQLAVLLAHGDQREVGGAAADVDRPGRRRPTLSCLRQPSPCGPARRRTRPAAPRAASRARSPASRAASTVSSRATASNEAGTVRTTSCARQRGFGASSPATRGSRPREVREVARRGLDRRDLRHLAGAPRQDAARRSTPAWHSHDLADETSRIGTGAPCLRANSPTTLRGLGLPQGSASAPGGTRLGGQIKERRQQRPRLDLARARPAAGTGTLERPASAVELARRPGPSWWCRGRCRRRAGGLTTAPPPPARRSPGRCRLRAAAPWLVRPAVVPQLPVKGGSRRRCR